MASYKGLPTPLDHPTNRFVHDVFTRGDVEVGFAQADLVVENTFTVPRVHQSFLEPHCCLVWIDDQDRVQMWSPNKVPHGLKESMSQAFGIPKEKIRVNPVAIGGDFGGKGAPIDEPICYLLAVRSRRPVKMVMEYREEFFAGAPRHAAIMKLKTGVKRDGTIVAHQMDAFLDAGAYGGFRPGAVVGGIAHAGGCYRAEHARISVSRVYTNNLPGGQMRAPGRAARIFRRGIAHGLRRAQSRHGSLRVPHEESHGRGRHHLDRRSLSSDQSQGYAQSRGESGGVFDSERQSTSAAAWRWVIAGPAAAPRR